MWRRSPCWSRWRTGSATTSATEPKRYVAELLLDKAQLLTLTAPEMTVLIGGLRALGANFGQSQHGVFTKRPETLTNDFFVNLLDMGTKWQKSATSKACWKDATGRRASSSGLARWLTSCLDRTRSSGPSRRCMRAAMPQQAFVQDFVAAWTKVMNLDRFDLAAKPKAKSEVEGGVLVAGD